MFSAIGNVLDIPGSMIRDILSGENPADQLLDPFGQEGRTSGADMLAALGMGEDHNLLGTGLEMLLDPTTYLGVGLAKNAIRGGIGAAKGLYGTVKGMNTAAKARAGLSAAKSAVKGGIKSAKSVTHGPMPNMTDLFGNPIMGPASGLGEGLRNVGTNAINAAYDPAIRNPLLGAMLINSAMSGREGNTGMTPEEEAYLYGSSR